ncbi:hypothetical protein BU23DRAFT_34998 [Bimuria novae-zelandiae CBS 107.79]|uniref:WKF domain-containing protein n=1 Tax=Bimuria novae-zelandiae CBS 107.79 TaxID=1447943 RepID=A0A6A5ULA2_9PLEO|nr:hypothetical protein BU23DRAFT_34998 [Bimuria novae-zelandiae CBS 107.79]
MAQPGAFVPAWKRLGLKLKNSSDADSNHQAEEQQNGQHPAQNGSAVREDSNASHNTKSKSKLGKRKHHSEAADIEGESVKKSKHDRENGFPIAYAVAVPDVEVDSPKLAPSQAPTPDQTPLKGDANYRRKKSGDSNYRKKAPKQAKSDQKTSWPSIENTDDQRESRQNLSVPRITRTPSLSPGHLDLAPNGSTLLPSTEMDFPPLRALATPERQQRVSTKDSSSSLTPQKTDRRKSVTFTPDTKTGDGNSASNLFKKWVAEQKGPSADFTPAEVADFTEPPKVHVANDNPNPISKTLKGTTAPKGKKDPSRYLNYLSQYQHERSNWKFNKAIQNDVLDNALNIFRIPDDYSEALLEYVGGLQGAGVIERLKERWTKAIEEIDEAERQNPMDEREAMKETALQERLSKERKRRRLDGDVEGMMNHPYSEGYIRRLKRSRAEALCAALKVPMPATTPQSGLRQIARQEASAQNNARKVKRTKRRTDVSSDESSDSSSSSEEESSSDESSEGDSASAMSSDADESEEDKNTSDSESDTDSSAESGDNASEADSD